MRSKFDKKMLARKALHGLGALILVILSIFRVTVTQLVIIVMLTLYIISESLRLSGRSLPLFNQITHLGSTKEEREGIVTAPIWFALGILITISFFTIDIAAIGVLTLTIGDPIAAIIGQTIDKIHPIPFNRSKSIEGTLAGYIIATILCSIITHPLPSIIGCATGMIVETLPIPVNDNLTIPLASSITGSIVLSLLV
jgi:dolichol kinase